MRKKIAMLDALEGLEQGNCDLGDTLREALRLSNAEGFVFLEEAGSILAERSIRVMNAVEELLRAWDNGDTREEVIKKATSEMVPEWDW